MLANGQITKLANAPNLVPDKKSILLNYSNSVEYIVHFNSDGGKWNLVI